MKARIAKEIVVRMPHELGALAGLSKLVSDKGTNILAISVHSEGKDDVVRMLTDDDLRTMDMLQARGFAPKEHEVVVVDLEHRPGMLRRLADTMAAERIDISHLYATAGGNAPDCYFVLSTSNNAHAVVVLRDSPPA
jgi:hypothetical protein